MKVKVKPIMLNPALRYAKRGWKVFPVFRVRNGKCDCGKNNCKSPGKHPHSRLAPNGFNAASTSPERIFRWWEQQPRSNVGLATGQASGIVGLDIYPRHGGDVALAESLSKPGELPVTGEAIT